jgi:hypothetical protein
MRTDQLSVHHLLKGLEPKDFLEQYWEKQPLHLAGRSADHYAALFDPRALNHVIWAAQHPWGKIQLANHNKGTGWNNYSRLEPNLVTLSQAYQQGDTIIVNDLQDNVDSLGQLCRSIAEDFNFRSGINLYLTKGGEQGLSPHFDDQDVFILQISGSKAWKLYDFVVRLPLDQAPSVESRAYGPPRREITLAPGDLLYLPRGYGHAAQAHQGEPSLHLTVSITVVRWLNVLTSLLQRVAELDESFRTAIPPGSLFGTSSGSETSVQDKLRRLLGRCAEAVNLDAAKECLDLYRENLIHSLRPLADRFILEEDLEVKSTSLIGKRRGVMFHCSTAGDEVNVVFPGGQIVVPRSLRDAIEFIARNDRFPVSALPIPDTDATKIAVARELIRQGVITRRDNA